MCFSLCVCVSACVPVMAGRYCVELLYRSDFFPGLGWMLLRNTWLELRDKWPAVYVPLISHRLTLCDI